MDVNQACGQYRYGTLVVEEETGMAAYVVALLLGSEGQVVEVLRIRRYEAVVKLLPGGEVQIGFNKPNGPE